MRVSFGLLVLGVALSAGTLAAQPVDHRPVVLTGADVPDLQGVAVTAPVCYAFGGGSWSQCPIQIDERDWLDPAAAYPATISDADELFGGPLQLLYTAPQDYPHAGFDPVVPADSEPALDANDELVLMARFFGDRADVGANPPPSAPGRVVEVAFEGRYAYLYAPTTPHDQSAGYDLVSYEFDLLAGAFPADYNFEGSTRLNDDIGDFLAANPEYSVAETAYYRTSFEDRWIQRELALGSGPDVLDRVKYGAWPDQLGENHDCSRSVYSASARRGTLGIQKDGPLRALRFAQGYNSGGHNYVLYEMYERYIVYRMAHQMHRTPGATMFFDHAPAASGMTYYSNLFPSGVAIDGSPDRAPGAYYEEAYIDWDYLLGTQGSIVSVWDVDTNIDGLIPYSYYEDNVTPEVGQCTGDREAYASSGNVYFTRSPEDPTLPWTDPPDSRSIDENGDLRYLRLVRRLTLDGAQLSKAQADAERSALQAPIVYTATPRDTGGGGPSDTTPPTITGALSGQTYTGTATDSGASASGIASVALGGGATNLTLAVDPFSLGASSVGFTATPIDAAQDASGTVVVRDVAGNQSTRAVSIPAPIVDSDPPLISGSVDGGSYTGTVRDDRTSDTGVASVALAAGSVNLALSVDPFSAGAPSVGFTATPIDGSQAASGTVVARDVAGNQSTRAISIPAPSVDNAAPQISGTVSGTTYTGLAQDQRADDTGIAAVRLAPGAQNLSLSVDPFTPGASSVGFTVSLTNPSQDGSGSVEAEDVAGNVATESISITGTGGSDDTTAPALSGQINGRQYDGTARDDRPGDSGVAAVTLAPDAVNLRLAVDPFAAGASSVAFTVTLANAGQQGKGYVNATDVAGNASELWVCSDGCPPPSEPPPLGVDTLEPELSGKIRGRRYEGTARDDRVDDTGIASVALGAGAQNLTLSVSPFTPGAPSVDFEVTLADPHQAGSGDIVATDVAGNVGTLFVSGGGRATGEAFAVSSSPPEVATASGSSSVALLPGTRALPIVLQLGVYPNPARATVAVGVGQPEDGRVRIELYDALGRRVATAYDGALSAGWHAFPLDIDASPSGVYVVRAVAGGRQRTVRFTVLR